MIGSFCRRVPAAAAFVVLLIAGASPAWSQDAAPPPEAFLGYELGERFTEYVDIRDYLRRLAEVSPRVAYYPYGQSVEGRELIQVVVAREDHLARLDEILALNAELVQRGTTAARAAEIAATNPAVVYFSYGIHGGEASSSEAALWTTYDLITDAPAVAGVLDSLVVVIDPVLNPDGRERYVQWYHSVVGATPNPDPQSREHREPWPGGRFNHYLFDLNRDWAWMSQPETRARVASWWRWNPQVHVDFHEMSPNSSYFFFPAAEPFNPLYPRHVLDWGARFGAANAAAFDVHGWPYFTRESYDMFYPGYGDSWPSLQGAIGMTYEQAGGGAAGLAYERIDGDTLTLAQRATQHRTTGEASLRAAAAGKNDLVLGFAEVNRTAGEGHRDFLLVPSEHDPSRLEFLVDHLLAQNIEVERAEQAFGTAAEPYPGFSRRQQFPAGTVLVRARQPRGLLALTLLQAETELQAEYAYDISAWSLPYAYGIEAHRISGPPAASWVRAVPSAADAALLPASAQGYLVPPTVGAGRAIVSFLGEGGVVRVLSRASTFDGRDYPAGTWYIPGRGDAALPDRMAEAGLARWAVPIRTGQSERGLDLGSNNVPRVQLPRIALVGGEGTAATSHGTHWFHLEQELGLDFSVILLPELGRIDLARYDVVILPDMNGMLADPAANALREWVNAGGRLVAVSGGAFAAAEIAEVERRQTEQVEEDPAQASGVARLLITREERERQQWIERVPGAILEIRTDPGHPLIWGSSFDAIEDRVFVLHERGRAFQPDENVEVAAFFGSELTATSGVISDANLRRLEQGAWLLSRRMGSGEVILFADDPLFRHFWRATMPMYRNAVLIGSR